MNYIFVYRERPNMSLIRHNWIKNYPVGGFPMPLPKGYGGLFPTMGHCLKARRLYLFLLLLMPGPNIFRSKLEK